VGAITAVEALRLVEGQVLADGREPAVRGRDGVVLLGVAGADERALAEQLAALYRAGATIDWLAVHAARRGRRVELPTYPYERQVYERPRPAGRRPNPPKVTAQEDVPVAVEAVAEPGAAAVAGCVDEPAGASERSARGAAVAGVRGLARLRGGRSPSGWQRQGRG
jgi:acyl transferase domain-containing protein